VTPDNDPDPLERRLRQAQAELERRLHAGEDCRAEEFFADCPALAAQAERALDLIYTEFAAREELGRRASPEEYYQRFPQWRAELAKQFAVHEEFPPAVLAVRLANPEDRLEHYQLLQEVGRGPTSKVYKAREVRRNQVVALKLLSDRDPADVVRFRNGAREQAGLRHPNILPVYDVGESEDGRPCFSMEFAEGAASTSGSPASRSRPTRRPGWCGRWPRPSSTPTANASPTATSSRPTWS
jgi:eukaryotic-like serine/threonine-protein kinase